MSSFVYDLFQYGKPLIGREADFSLILLPDDKIVFYIRSLQPLHLLISQGGVTKVKAARR